MAKASQQTNIGTNEIKAAYIDFVLTHNEPPKSVYVFCKSLSITEAEFYRFYASFEAIEKSIWSTQMEEVIATVQEQPIWKQFTAKEKMLSFFYGFIEHIKTQRSFILYSFKRLTPSFGTPEPLKEARLLFESFAEEIINEGLETKELADRKFFSKKYKDALWMQLVFVLKFWEKDNSTDFEKTDEAIEKGLQVTFDLFQHSPLDNLFEYGKFLVRNARVI